MKIIVQRGPEKAQRFWKNPKFFSLSETFPPFQLLTLSQTTNFGLFQTERVCRRQFQISFK